MWAMPLMLWERVLFSASQSSPLKEALNVILIDYVSPARSYSKYIFAPLIPLDLLVPTYLHLFCALSAGAKTGTMKI